MKKLQAFGLALLLFLCTATGLHVLAGRRLEFNDPKFNAWVNDEKLLYSRAICENLGPNTIPVFGSSEFRHGRSTPYHAAKVLSGQPFQLMLIGAGYYQSLFHATALAAIGPAMEQDQAVLILSPQWFKPSGVLPEVYTSRFSAYNFVQMLKNDKLSQQTKEYIIQRTKQLLEPDPAMGERVDLYERVLVTKDTSLWDKLHYKAWTTFLEEKMTVGLLLKAKAAGIRHDAPQPAPRPAPDWAALEAQADADGAKANTTNQFGMNDDFYFLYKNTMLKSKKDSMKQADYTQSPEYGDLICFLNVCRDLGIRPLLVSLPVNGPWYDYMGFPQQNRQAYYQKIRDIAAEYGAELADLSTEEYTPHFFEDNTHIAWKGWVKLNESLYRFAAPAA